MSHKREIIAISFSLYYGYFTQVYSIPYMSKTLCMYTFLVEKAPF